MWKLGGWDLGNYLYWVSSSRIQYQYKVMEVLSVL